MILGVALEELLLRRLADTRMTGHVDTGPGPVAARLPRALGALDGAARVEHRCVFTEVPDVSGSVLRAPVCGPLPQLAVEEQPV